MKKETNKKKEIIAAALRGDRAEFDRLTRAKLTFFKVDEQHYKGNLESPITEAEFKNSFEPGYDSIFELSSNSDELEQLEELGFNPDEFPRIARNVKNEANIINELLTKLDNE